MRLQTDIIENSVVKYSFTHAAATQAEAQILADAHLAKFQLDPQFNAQTMTVQFSVNETNVQETARMLFMQQQKNVAFGSSICAKILAIAGAKAMSDAAIDALFASTLLMTLERMLKNGSITVAKRNIEAADLTGLLSADEKTNVVNEMQAYLDAQ